MYTYAAVFDPATDGYRIIVHHNEMPPNVWHETGDVVTKDHLATMLRALNENQP